MENEKDFQLTEAEKQALLRERAKIMAIKPEVVASSENIISIIEFSLGIEKYGIESRYAREVHTIRNITELPGTPAFVAGVISIRGEILSVIDLKVFFDIPALSQSEKKKAIIISSPDMEFGLLADSVTGERQLAQEDIQYDLPALSGIRAEYSLGITSDRTVILNGLKILNDEKIIINEDV